jgi:DNA-directed RNA polymerase specialized sigma24 family protein
LVPSASVPGDDELLRAVGEGEVQAIALVYQRHGAKMVSFARRYVNDPGSAEDVVAELLGRWLERPPRIRDAERIGAFLATSVYHAAIDWIRQERVAHGSPPRGGPCESAYHRPWWRTDSRIAAEPAGQRARPAIARRSVVARRTLRADAHAI